MYLSAHFAFKWKRNSAAAGFFGFHLEFSTDNTEKENKNCMLSPTL